MTSTNKTSDSVFDRLGIVPVINACGIYTDLGGSILSADTWSALTELNSSFVDMIALLERTGERIAGLVGAEAARITPGASAAIALSVAACIVSRNAKLGEQLPDVAGLKGEIVMQRLHHDAYRYLSPLRLPGAKVVLAGSAQGTTRAQLDRAIGPQTAAVFVPAHLEQVAGCMNIDATVAAASAHDVPVIVDAAYMNFPPQHMRTYAARGATLTCFSSKYFFGPNAGGFLSGRREYIDAIAALDFTRHESGAYRRFGRAFKLGRFEAAAVLLALQQWFDMDHEQRLASNSQRAHYLQRRLAGARGLSVEVRCFTLDERLVDVPVNAAVVSVRPESGFTARQLIERLAAGRPSIRAVAMQERIVLVTETLLEGHEELIARRILEAVGAQRG